MPHEALEIESPEEDNESTGDATTAIVEKPTTRKKKFQRIIAAIITASIIGGIILMTRNRNVFVKSESSLIFTHCGNLKKSAYKHGNTVQNSDYR